LSAIKIHLDEDAEEVRRLLKLSEAKAADAMESNLEFLSNWV
jgi:hypothetical protein